jgi:hypothetical protein
MARGEGELASINSRPMHALKWLWCGELIWKKTTNPLMGEEHDVN